MGKNNENKNNKKDEQRNQTSNYTGDKKLGGPNRPST